MKRKHKKRMMRRKEEAKNITHFQFNLQRNPVSTISNQNIDQEELVGTAFPIGRVCRCLIKCNRISGVGGWRLEVFIEREVTKMTNENSAVMMTFF